jgi:hypothetical protein
MVATRITASTTDQLFLTEKREKKEHDEGVKKKRETKAEVTPYSHLIPCFLM